MELKLSLLAGVLFAMAAGCAAPQVDFAQIREAWNDDNNPDYIDLEFQHQFVAMPLSARVLSAYIPWADSNWPTQLGGVAQRWYQPNESEDAFNYSLLTKEQVMQKSTEELQRLSPAEKYDIFMDRYDYPTVVAERKRTSPSAEPWEGLGHGWVAASILYSEPGPSEVKNSAGALIRFGASDVKALLTYYEAEIRRNRGSAFIGMRCDADLSVDPAAGSSPECRDTNAGAFHILLGNRLGLQRKGFIVDINRDTQVQNKPVIAYKTDVVGEEVPSAGANPKTVRELSVNTTLVYLNETMPDWYPRIGTEAQQESSIFLSYRLELDADGKIVGGEWLSDARPDFAWIPAGGTLTPYWKGLNKIYKPVF